MRSNSLVAVYNCKVLWSTVQGLLGFFQKDQVKASNKRSQILGVCLETLKKDA